MQLNYKRLSLFLVFTCILLGSSLTYVVLSQGTNIPTITSGPYAGAPSYTVYKEGSTYYAKNAYGNNDYEGASASTVINNAVDNPNSRIVLLKANSFPLDASITIEKSDFILEGEGTGTIITTSSATINLILVGDPTYVTPYENVQIRNLKVDSAVVKSAGSGIEFRAMQEVGALRPAFSGVFNVVIENQFDGLVLSACTGVWVSNVEVLYSVNVGIKIYNTGNSIHLTDIEIDGEKTEAYGTSTGIYLAKTIELWATNVHIVRSTIGLYIYGESNWLLGSIFFDNLMASDNKDFGAQIWLKDTSTVAGIYFSNCMFATNGMLYAPTSAARGVDIANSGSGAVEGFSFSQCDFFQNGGHGFHASSGSDFRFTSSTFVNNGRFANNTYSGAYFESGVSNFQFVGNKFLSGARGGISTQTYGVYVTSGASDWYMISNNIFKGNTVAPYYDGGSGTHKNITNNVV